MAPVAPVLLALFVLAGCVTSSGSTTPQRPAGEASPVQTTGRAPAQDGAWRHIANAPIAPAGGMAAAWTGRQLVVWGGAAGGGNWSPATGGAAYDPAADRWTVLPAAPVPGRMGATAVWSGKEVLVWGGQTGPATVAADGAAYDPATTKWRTLPAAPIGGRAYHQAVWTGKDMLVWGGFAQCCPTDSVIHDPAAAAYDPATNRWRRIADVPPPWSGDDGTALTVTDGDRPLVWRAGRLAAYDTAADRWSEIPGSSPAPKADSAHPATTADPFAVGAMAGGELFVWSGPAGTLSGAAYRPASGTPPGASTAPASGTSPSSAGTWRRTASLDGQSGGALAAGGPDRLFAAAGQSARILEYRIGGDRWTDLPLAPVPTRSAAVLVWTGSGLLFWGGIGDEGPEMDGAMWHCC